MCDVDTPPGGKGQSVDSLTSYSENNVFISTKFGRNYCTDFQSTREDTDFVRFQGHQAEDHEDHDGWLQGLQGGQGQLQGLKKDMDVSEDFRETKDNAGDFGEVKDGPKAHWLSQNRIYLSTMLINRGQCHCSANVLLLEPELDSAWGRWKQWGYGHTANCPIFIVPLSLDNGTMIDRTGMRTCAEE